MKRNTDNSENKNGTYALTPSGMTYYEYRKSTGSGTAVFIHGFSVSSGVWEKNFYSIHEKGYSVLRFDRFGTGRSCTECRINSIDLFVQQLKELVDVVLPPLPLTIIGLSMGSTVAACFASMYPQLAGTLCLIAPAVYNALPLVSRVLMVPGLGALANRIFIRFVFKKTLLSSLPPNEDDSSFLSYCINQADKPEYRAALLSTARHTLFKKDSFRYGSIPDSAGVIHIIWGTDDKVMPIRLCEKICQALDEYHVYRIEGAGHCPNWEQPQKVNDILLDILATDKN